MRQQAVPNSQPKQTQTPTKPRRAQLLRGLVSKTGGRLSKKAGAAEDIPAAVVQKGNKAKEGRMGDKLLFTVHYCRN